MVTIADRGFAARLVDEIAQQAKFDPATRSVTFSDAFLMDERELLLFDLLVFHPEVTPDEGRRMLSGALFAAAVPPGLSIRRFESELNAREKIHLSQPVERHVLVTQVSIDRRVDMPRMVEDGVTISLPAAIPTAFSEARDAMLKHATHSLYGSAPQDYRWIRASVSAKTPMSAGRRALDAIEFRMGLLNLGVNRRTGVRWSSGQREPVSSVALAPVHTLHRPSGRPSCESWWYEPGFIAPLKPQSKPIPDALDFCERALHRLARVPYAARYKDWIRFYGRAMGERNWTTSFILLWQTLESVTATANAKYDMTVRRASFLYDDFELSRRVLENLRVCRNALVHAQIDYSDMEHRMYMLKRHVEHLLVFHLQHAGDFATVDEAGQFLDLPASANDLRKRLGLVAKAARFRGLG